MIDAFLKQFVKPGALGLNLRQVSDLRPQGNAELMGTVAGQPQLFLIITFE